MDDEVCGGMIHTIDKVLMPPIGNLMDLLSMDPKHSTFMELIKFADLENELNEHVGPLTILAPRYGLKYFLKSSISTLQFRITVYHGINV